MPIVVEPQDKRPQWVEGAARSCPWWCNGRFFKFSGDYGLSWKDAGDPQGRNYCLRCGRIARGPLEY